MPSTKTYPENWYEITERRKSAFDDKCERCSKPDSHNPKDGNCLTVHHLIPDTTINEDWNLAVLCQRCHLHMQHIDMFQGYLFEVTGWLKWHIDGMKQWQATT